MALYSFDSSMKLISNLINLFEVYCWPSVMMMIKNCLLVYYYLLLRCSVGLCRMNELRMDTASILLGCAWLDHWIAVSITKDLAIGIQELSAALVSAFLYRGISPQATCQQSQHCLHGRPSLSDGPLIRSNEFWSSSIGQPITHSQSDFILPIQNGTCGSLKYRKPHDN